MTERDDAVLRSMVRNRRQWAEDARRSVVRSEFDHADRWDMQADAIEASLAALDSLKTHARALVKTWRDFETDDGCVNPLDYPIQARIDALDEIISPAPPEPAPGEVTR